MSAMDAKVWKFNGLCLILEFGVSASASTFLFCKVCGSCVVTLLTQMPIFELYYDTRKTCLTMRWEDVLTILGEHNWEGLCESFTEEENSHFALFLLLRLGIFVCI